MIQSNHRPTTDAPVALTEPARGDVVIVCGLDGSDGCVEISRIATALAAGLGGRAELVHVLGGDSGFLTALGVEDERTQARAMLDSLVDAGEVEITSRLIEFGDPARRVAAVAESLHADLIVVGSRGNMPVTDALIGRVSGRLAADAPCPVLVVPSSVQCHVRPRTWWSRTIVCGFDGSETAWSAALQAGSLAARLGGTVRLVTVGTAVPWSMADVAEELRARLDESSPAWPAEPCAVDWELRSGDPAWELERVASAVTAPLIAVGSRGAGPRTDPLLGAVTRRLLLAARQPILVTPATSDAVLTP